MAENEATSDISGKPQVPMRPPFAARQENAPRGDRRFTGATGTKAEKNGLKADTTAFKSEVNALINSVEIALSKRRGQTRTNIYEDIKSDAHKVLSALDGHEAHHQLESLKRQHFAIHSLLADTSRKKKLDAGAFEMGDEEEEGHADRPRAIASLQHQHPAAEPVAEILAIRRGALEISVGRQAALEGDAATLVRDAQVDVAATLEVAALMHGGERNRDELARFLAVTEKKMRQAETLSGAAGSGMPVEERLSLIMRHGRRIAGTMGAPAEETSAAVSAAMEDILETRLKAHERAGGSRLAQARAALEAGGSADTAKFDEEAGEWLKSIYQAEAGLRAASARIHIRTALRHAAASREDLFSLFEEGGAMFRAVDGHMREGMRMLEAQSEIMKTSLRRVESAEQSLRALKAGEYNADAALVAALAGVSREEVYKEAGEHQQAHGIASESMKQLGKRIETINTLWRDLVGGERGHSMVAEKFS